MKLKLRQSTVSEGRAPKIVGRARTILDNLEFGEVVTFEELADDLNVSYTHIKSAGLPRFLTEYSDTATLEVYEAGTKTVKRIFGNKETIAEWRKEKLKNSAKG